MPRHYDDSDEDLYENPYAESDTDADDDDVDVVENPASVVRTARDERLWRMAKASAAKQGRARDWPYVMGIFQRMKHHEGGAALMNPDDEDAPPPRPPTMEEARAARLARSLAFEIPPEPDYAAIAAQVEQERLEHERQRAEERAKRQAAPPPPPPPALQLRAAVVQQGLFAPSSYEAKPQKKKKPAPPVDTRQRDLFGLPIDDEPRENPDEPPEEGEAVYVPIFAVKTNFPDADLWVIRKGTPDKVGSVTKTFSPEHVGVQVLAPDLILPDYLYYVLMHLHSQGFYRERMKGALRLQHIGVDDVKDALRLLRFG